MCTLSTASQIDAHIASAISSGLPRLSVLVARSSSPSPLYESHSGVHHFPSAEHPQGTSLTKESVFHMASCTKLVTVIAAVQLVERGAVGLDDDMREVLPSLKRVGILKGWDEQGRPKVEETPRVTMRELITHTAGFTYNDDEQHEKYRAHENITLMWETHSTIESVTKIPLVYEPGTRFHYGMSNDWLGFCVAQLAGVSLEEYFQTNIFGPLGLNDISFLLPNPQKIDQCLGPIPKSPRYTPHPGQVLSQTYQLGGAGLSGTPSSYLKLLQSILAGANAATPSPLLKPETIRSMFEDQLTSEVQREDLAEQTWEGNPWGRKLGKEGWLQEVKPGWGLGGALSGRELASGRGKGAMFWSGFANTFWVMDREKDVAFVVWGNSIPHGDDALFAVWDKIEPLIYQALGEEAKEQRMGRL